MATNILGLMDYVQQQGDKGRQQGQQQSFNRLAGQAYTAPAAQQGALVGQMVGIDPQAGMAVGSALAGRNQAAETDHLTKLRGAAQFALDALKSRDPARIQGAGNAVGPYLTQLTGKQFPGLNESMLPALYQVLAQTGGDPAVKGVVANQGAQVIDPATGRVMASVPFGQKYQNVPMGEGSAAGTFDPNTGAVRPAVGGMPQGDPMQPFIEQANHAMQMGAPEEKVRAWLMQQAQQMGAQPQAPGQSAAQPSQFGVGTPAGPKPQNETWNQPVDETSPDGKPIRVQYSNTGERRVVDGAAPATKAADAKLQMQARAAKSSLIGTVAQLDRLEQAAQQLKNDTGLGGITGVRGHIPDYPGSDAARARAQLETLKSQVGFGVLQQMREMSKTGGALGSVSDRENSLLQNNLAALSTNQSPEDFQRALDQVVAYARDSKARLQGAYNTTYGDEAPQAPGQTQAPAGGVDSLLSKYGVQ